MQVQVTLNVSPQVVQDAERIARQSQRPLESVLSEWLDRAAAELPVALLSDEALVAVCERRWPEERHAELSGLLAQKSEGLLDEDGRQRLEGLMQQYDQDLLRKADALKEAVRRGLRGAPSR